MNDTSKSISRSLLALDTSVTYLNTGAFGPMSLAVFQRVTDLRQKLAQDPVNYLLRECPELLHTARLRLADYIGADARQLFFTTNVTAAINLVAASIRLEAPGEILISDHEYEPMRWCWERAAKRSGLSVRTFRVPLMPTSPEAIVDSATAAMRPTTRVLFFSHVLSSTGLILPAQKLCEKARARNILTVIDGAHAPVLTDLAISQISCDFYAGSGHKWMLAPTGTGFLYIGENREDFLEPLQVSFGYHLPSKQNMWDVPDRYGSTPRLRRFECEGTRDISPWLALPETIDFLDALGDDTIRAHMKSLSEHARNLLQTSLGLPCLTPAIESLHSGMTSFALPPDTNWTYIAEALWSRYRIEVGILGAYQGSEHALLRVSTHVFNSENDLEYLVHALQHLVANDHRLTGTSDKLAPSN